MIGVNDLAKRWDNTDAAMGERYMGRVDAAADLVMLAETAWKPVSEPPTKADSENDFVLVVTERGDVDMAFYNCVAESEDIGVPDGTYQKIRAWARIRDVVLMPPQGVE